MKWEVISNERSSLQEYRLIENNDCKVVIKYNPRHQSARITSGSHHRLFFLESAGSLSGKTVFKNEYGMEVGNLVHDKFHPGDGSIMIDSKKYQYHLQNTPLPELVIYSNDRHQAVANCDIHPTLITTFHPIPTQLTIIVICSGFAGIYFCQRKLCHNSILLSCYNVLPLVRINLSYFQKYKSGWF